ncbi:hypothetical protein CGLAU_01165 [Corynebacterium glaucum]|uniref:Lipoprotein n=1 Tax=Corynebacterium glaucum TaxID=187491 RepID=A0A1Q2HTQ6_9CORY|nr:hypothetical protein [Corynebacterium glaucum]AQQ14224.1 hypothetical protein CGLAU_01165 [Corynebacterium glaucum]WJZ06740.1 hypothetical protein CGLAUT_01150 [Corynebacterium glaucum]
MRKTTTLAATFLATSALLVGCGTESLDGTYQADIDLAETSTPEEEEALKALEQMGYSREDMIVTYKLKIEGETCEQTISGVFGADTRMDCEVDRDKEVIRATGDVATGDPEIDEMKYVHDGDTITLVPNDAQMDMAGGAEGEREVVLTKVEEN